ACRRFGARLARGALEQQAELRLVRVAVTVAPCVLFEVALQVAAGNGVVGAANAVLDEAKEALDGVRVYVAADVHTLGVLDPAVRVPLVESFVAAELVGE